MSRSAREHLSSELQNGVRGYIGRILVIALQPAAASSKQVVGSAQYAGKKSLVSQSIQETYYNLTSDGSDQPMSVPERNRFIQAIQYELGVAADMRTLSTFV